MQYDLIVVGGGAAGFFGAIQAAEMRQGLNVLILEKSVKVLSKVKVSGGGRCNVTNQCSNPYALAHHYPRGEKPLKEVFNIFATHQTIDWFAAKGISLFAEEDGRMFPISNSSETIIDCFVSQAIALKIKIELTKAVSQVAFIDSRWRVTCVGGGLYSAKCLLIATGGSPNKKSYKFIADLGHSIIDPVPSLFTFNDAAKKFKDLMGVAVADAEVKIAGTKFSNRGPVLITHWGLSGPAVIKLSAWSAVYLSQVAYEFTALVNWVGQINENEARTILFENKKSKARQKVYSSSIFSLPLRLTQRLYTLAGVAETKVWAELPNKTLNKLVELLIRCPFEIKGKTTFKEEFVTCGGVDLNEINLSTMESKIQKNIFFAGEVLNVDGETGGFNFQSAWSTSYIAATAIAQVT